MIIEQLNQLVANKEILNGKYRHLDSSKETYCAWNIVAIDKLWPSWYVAISHRCSKGPSTTEHSFPHRMRFLSLT